ncbi:MAG: hypothetical protein R3D67_20335 [Hyphomicrobiaceae bacterium]
MSADRLHVLGIELAVELDWIRQAGIAHQHGEIDHAGLAARTAGGKLGSVCGNRRRRAIMRDPGPGRKRPAPFRDGGHTEAALLQQLGDALLSIEALGVELVGHDAGLVIDDDLAADEALAILADRTLAADEMVSVDPLHERRSVVRHVGTVGDVEDELA